MRVVFQELQNVYSDKNLVVTYTAVCSTSNKFTIFSKKSSHQYNLRGYMIMSTSTFSGNYKFETKFLNRKVQKAYHEINQKII